MRRIRSSLDLKYEDIVRINQLVDSIFIQSLPETVEDIVELYSVSRYLDKCPNLLGDISKGKGFIISVDHYLTYYFSSFNLEEHNESLKDIHKYYRCDFWRLANTYKLFDHASTEQVKKFLKRNEILTMEVIGYHALFDCHKTILKELLFSEPQYFEIFMMSYGSSTSSYADLLAHLTEQEVNDWARRYCGLDDPKPDYLEQVVNWCSKDGWRIDPVIREMAESLLNILTRIGFWLEFENSDVETMKQIRASEENLSEEDMLKMTCIILERTINKK